MSTRKKHLHFNCFSGAGGDMVLSALVDLGADKHAIAHELCTLNIGVSHIEFSDVMRSGVRGVHLKITESGESNTDSVTLNHSTQHEHPHTHHGTHSAHSHASSPTHNHSHSHGSHRYLNDMLEIIKRCTAGENVKKRASHILQMLAEAEGRIHAKPVDQIHFHEISGVDTIVDVLGSCLALEMLGVDSISASLVTVGRGMMHCAHGHFPVPAPATLEILAKATIPYKQGNIDGELLTPTGAALLAAMVGDFGSSPAMRPERTGYGAGSNEYDNHPNLLQATLGYCE